MARPKGKSKVDTLEQKCKIAKMHRQGYTQWEISRKVGISQPAVCQTLQVIKEEAKALAALKEQMYPELRSQQLTDSLNELWKAWERSKGEYSQEELDLLTEEELEELNKIKMRLLPDVSYMLAIIKCLDSLTKLEFPHLARTSPLPHLDPSNGFDWDRIARDLAQDNIDAIEAKIRGVLEGPANPQVDHMTPINDPPPNSERNGSH